MKISRTIIFGILATILAVTFSTAAFSLLTHTRTVRGYGRVTNPIPLLMELYKDEECTEILDEISFQEFTIATGIEQTEVFYIKNNLERNIRMRWRLNPDTLNIDKWIDSGRGYFYSWPSRDNGWFLQLYWNYKERNYIQTSYPSEQCWRTLESLEIHELTLSLTCPYDSKSEVQFIIDIIAEEIL